MRAVLTLSAAAGALAACALGPTPTEEAPPPWLAARIQAADAENGRYPELSDVPERPSDMPDEAEWRRRVEALDSKRVDVLANPDYATAEERGESEEFAEDARKKAGEGLDAYDDLPNKP
jgi:hypothetical protein